MTNDVVSLPIAKKLKEAGWKQEARDYFCTDAGEQTYSQCCAVQFKKATCGHHIALASIGELLEALPQKVKVKEGQWSILHLQRNTPSNWEAFYNFAHIGRQNNPADALALLFIELKKKGLV